MDHMTERLKQAIAELEASRKGTRTQEHRHMIYLDLSNTTFLQQTHQGLFWVSQEDAAAGVGWQPFTQWGDDALSGEELQEVFDALIRCQAPRDRVPEHLREHQVP